jgi:release factor glutamine methyltransferase
MTQTIAQALNFAKTQIEPASDSASLDAQMLLGEIIKQERDYLLAHPEQPLTEEQQAHYVEWIRRRAAGEPVAYIIGRRAFYDREIAVTRDVLIPRPETELLLEQALVFIKEHPLAAAVDVGTGSGALAVTLAAHCPQAQVYATDISPAALATARYNAFLNEVNITFFNGDLLEPLISRQLRVDVVMANLPYIATDELANLEVSRHEPRLALDGGVDGLDVIRRLLTQIPAACKPGALILLEIGANQGGAALELVRNLLPSHRAQILKDYSALDRIVKIEDLTTPRTE